MDSRQAGKVIVYRNSAAAYEKIAMNSRPDYTQCCLHVLTGHGRVKSLVASACEVEDISIV